MAWMVYRDDPRAMFLFKKAVNCKDKRCPHYRHCCRLPTSFTHKPVEVMFVGEGAGEQEAKYREPFVGKSGALLKATVAWLIESRLKKSVEKFGLAFTNLVRCRPVDQKGANRAPDETELKHCLTYLKRDLLHFRPKVVVALGDVPLQVLSGDPNAKVYATRGVPRKVNLFGHECYLAATRHPSYILRTPEDLPDFVQDLRLYLLSLPVLGRFPKLDPTVLGEHYEIVESTEELKNVVDELLRRKYVAFDIEAQNLNRRYGNKILTVQLSGDGRRAYVVPVCHPDSPFAGTDVKEVKRQLRRLFSVCPQDGYPLQGFIAHNATFDLHQLRTFLSLRYVPLPVIDTMLQAYLCEDNYARGGGRLGLKDLTRRYGFNYESRYTRALEYRDKGALDRLPLEEVADYGAADAVLTHQLYRVQNLVAVLEDKNLPPKVQRLLKYFYHPLLQLFVELEQNGLPVNPKRVSRLVDRNESPVIETKQNILDRFFNLPSVRKANRILARKSTGVGSSVWGDVTDEVRAFNPNSAQHRALLFGEILRIKLPTTAAGNPSLTQKVLKKLAEQGYEEAKLLQHLAQVEKMFSSFIKPTYEKLIQDSDAADGFIRPNFHAAGTVTGRISASNPNCLAGSTRVVVDGYGALRLSDIYKLNLVGEYVVVGGEKYRIAGVWEKRVRNPIVINTVCGRQLVGSRDHRLLVRRNGTYVWLPMAKIQVGDDLVAQLPVLAGYRPRPGSRAARATVAEARRLGEYFREVSNLPSWLFSAPRHIVEAFFEGLVGRKIGPKDKFFIDLKEYGRRVTYDLHLLATLAGFDCSSFYYDDCMGLIIYGKVEHLTFALCPVRSVRTLKGSVYLYDMEVEGGHHFLADGLISHNSQQIPKVKGDELTKRVRYYTRAMFEAPPGWAFIELDFSTNEVRGLGIVSRDPTLIETFKHLKKTLEEFRRNPTPELKLKLKNADPHRVNTSIAYGIPPDQVTDEQRDGIKVVTFGTIYGMSLPTLAATLGKTEEEAKEIYERLFSKLQVAKKWLEDTIKHARTHLIVESLLGRRRRLYQYLLPDARSKWADADRRAVNSPIQGLSSDFALIGAFNFYFECVVKQRRNWVVCNTVHDSVLILVPYHDVPECLLTCEKFFTDHVESYVEDKFGLKLPLPLGVDFKAGINLAEMKKWDFTEEGLKEIVKFVYREARKRGKVVEERWQLQLPRYQPCPDLLFN